MIKRILSLFMLSVALVGSAAAQHTLSGTVRDAKTAEPVIGAIVMVEGSLRGTSTGADGTFTLAGVPRGSQRVVFSFLSYTDRIVELDVRGDVTGLDVTLAEEAEQIEQVVVRGRMRSDTENAMVGTVRMAPQVVSGVSAAQIARSPDRTASEVVRRVPGITIIDDRFVIVRGLSQRYNNAWINGLAVPSTETDSRAFSFDLIPGSQIDNLLVYKSPSPEIPGDFSGGFVRITTKSLPDANRTEVGFQTGFNTNTQFTDFRSVDGWSIRERTPLPDLRASLTVARRFDTRGGKAVGHITAVNFSHTYKTIEEIVNTRYGIYSADADRPIVLNDYRDNQYAKDLRLGVLHNWSIALNANNRVEFRNLFNLLTRDRLTEREGVSDNSGTYYQRQTERADNRRLTYTGQFSGTHDLRNNATLTWDAGYSYAGLREPDRWIAVYQLGIGNAGDRPSSPLHNDRVTRYDQTLDDHTVSAAAAYRQDLGRLTLRTGLYGELRTRDYTPREQIYRYDRLGYDERADYLLLPLDRMMGSPYVADGTVWLDDITKDSDAYSAEVIHGAAYGVLDIPLGKLEIHAGARLESHTTRLTYDRNAAQGPDQRLMATLAVDDLDVLPSVNLTWKFNERHQLRAAYGRSVNRPELRELSPSVYYDFDLFSEIGGNPDLKTAQVDNADLRWEFYPATGETISFGAFYKHFKNPIEWTFIDMGGTLRYLYENAEKAVSWGFELDVRKSLGFVGAPNLSLVLNAAWIESNVTFTPGELVSEPDRPMQGQSPYIVNTGLYYSSERLGLDVAVLYNRIGRRVVGLGKSNSNNPDPGTMIPDSYEMPRNSLDASLSKRLSERVELRASVRDILSEDIVYRQFPRFVRDGVTHEREQTTRRYNPGQSVAIGVNVKF